MYRVEYRKSVLKTLRRMPRRTATRFISAFEAIATDPNDVNLDIKPLAGRDGFRLRIGEWRALYRLVGERLILLVLDVGPRGGIYK